MWYFKWVILSGILALLVAGAFDFMLRLVFSALENVAGHPLFVSDGGGSQISIVLFFFFWLLLFLLFKRIFHDDK